MRCSNETVTALNRAVLRANTPCKCGAMTPAIFLHYSLVQDISKNVCVLLGRFCMRSTDDTVMEPHEGGLHVVLRLRLAPSM